MQNIQEVYEKSREYMTAFLHRIELDNASVNTLEYLLQKYVDISVYPNKKDNTFRFLATEQKIPGSTEKPKTIQLFYFGKSNQKEMCGDVYSEFALEQVKTDFLLFSKYFKIQKKFAEIMALEQEIEEYRKK